METLFFKKTIENNYITTTQLAKILGTSNAVVLSVAKRIGIKKDRINGVVIKWTEEEANKIVSSIQYNNPNSNKSLIKNKDKIKTQEMLKNEAKTGLKALSQLPFVCQLKAANYLYNNIIEKQESLNKSIIQLNDNLTQTVNILMDYKIEKEKIEKEKMLNKELRADINKEIKKKAKKHFDYDYKKTWNYYYKIYQKQHCFSEIQDLDKIQKRGGLKEFLNIIKSDF